MRYGASSLRGDTVFMRNRAHDYERQDVHRGVLQTLQFIFFGILLGTTMVP